MNPEKTGTKSAAHYQLNVGAGRAATVRLRLTDTARATIGDPFKKRRNIEIKVKGPTKYDLNYKPSYVLKPPPAIKSSK